jgi:hypothetical protein
VLPPEIDKKESADAQALADLKAEAPGEHKTAGRAPAARPAGE